jgi:2-polyprenyl-3-methyl-5-hydroxy-6-metoxy-1,4-benzoquinol methylase
MSPPDSWQRIEACGVCGHTDLVHVMTRGVDGSTLDRCRGCSVALLNPRPSADQVRAWYDEAYFTGRSSVTMGPDHLDLADAAVRHGTEPFRQLSQRLALKGCRLLEVGCGAGAFLLQCRSAGADVTGLDVSAFAVHRLAERYGVPAVVGTVESTSLAEGSFDIVAFVDVLEHVLSPRAFMEGVRRLLSGSGVIFGVLPNLDCVEHYGRRWAGLERHPEHLYYFGAQALRNLLEACGLRTIEVWTYGEPATDPGPARLAAQGPGQGWRDVLRRVRLLRGVVRAGRTALRRLSRAERERQRRYRQGLGHDLYFLASKAEFRSAGRSRHAS